MENFLLSCDWGTSSFRLRLIDVHHHRIHGELLSRDGAASMHEQWKGSPQLQTSIERFYFQKLRRDIDVLQRDSPVSLQDVPVVISGMASSGIGLRELSYATVPFALDGSQAHVAYISPTDEFPHKVYLISGVRSLEDVMRGEETQVVGLAAMNSDVYGAEDAVCILPGTHSKHIRLHQGGIVDFQTYMTGELFDVVAHHGLLKDAISGYGRSEPPGKAQMDAFCLGVQQTKTSNLLHALFTVRINQLFDLLKKGENLYYLSGLLIGSELRDVPDTAGQIVLCSGSNVYFLYHLAIREMHLEQQTTFIEADLMDKAVVEGQLRILQYQPSWLVNGK